MKALIVAVLALSSTLLLAQRSGNAVSRSASPTGTRDLGRAQRTPDFSPKDAKKLSPLLGITSEELLDAYTHDRRTCNVRPTTYVALRLAEKQNELAPEHTTQTVLQNMCAKKTRSFAFSLNKSAQDQKAEQKNLLVVEQKLHEK
jgi:hypothetical protein